MEKYLVLAVSVMSVMALFAAFDFDDADDYDITGIAHDVRKTQSGYFFDILTHDGRDIRCFSSSSFPEELQYCGIVGSMSSDGSVFFVNRLDSLEDSI